MITTVSRLLIYFMSRDDLKTAIDFAPSLKIKKSFNTVKATKYF